MSNSRSRRTLIHAQRASAAESEMTAFGCNTPRRRCHNAYNLSLGKGMFLAAYLYVSNGSGFFRLMDLVGYIELIAQSELPESVFRVLRVILHDVDETKVVTDVKDNVVELIRDAQRNGQINLVELL